MMFQMLRLKHSWIWPQASFIINIMMNKFDRTSLVWNSIKTIPTFHVNMILILFYSSTNMAHFASVGLNMLKIFITLPHTRCS